MSALRIGTRGSALALWQARRVAELIGAQRGSPPVELVYIKTEGDVRTDVPLWAVGGRAFFTSTCQARWRCRSAAAASSGARPCASRSHDANCATSRR